MACVRGEMVVTLGSDFLCFRPSRRQCEHWCHSPQQVSCDCRRMREIRDGRYVTLERSGVQMTKPAEGVQRRPRRSSVPT